MTLYTEKNLREAIRPLSSYNGDNTFVKGQIYAMSNGGDTYDYSKNLKSYNKALEDSKANDKDNFWTGVGDLLVGRGADKMRADIADKYVQGFEKNPYVFSGDDYRSDIGKVRTEQDFDKGRYLNGGLIGTLINPLTQVGKATSDFGEGVRGDWSKWNKRDYLSDAGATVESILNLVPIIGGKKLVASTLGKTFGKAVGKSALWSGMQSAAGGIKDMGSENFDLGNLLARTAIGTTIGGALGGAGYGLRKVGDKLANVAKNNRATVENITTPLFDDMGRPIAKNGVSYQDALRKVGLDQASSPKANHLFGKMMSGAEISGDDLPPEAMDVFTDRINAFVKELGGNTKQASNLKPGLAFYDKTGRSQASARLQDALASLKTIPQATETVPVTTYSNDLAKTRFKQILQGSKDLIKDYKGTSKNVADKVANSKTGTLASKLLKSKTGKLGLGLGSGLLLSKLMNGGSGDVDLNQMSDEELYNYVINGGQ